MKDDFIIETANLLTCSEELTMVSTYYGQYASNFSASNFNATGCAKLASYLSSIRNSYGNISVNIGAISSFIKKLQEEIEILENKNVSLPNLSTFLVNDVNYFSSSKPLKSILAEVSMPRFTDESLSILSNIGLLEADIQRIISGEINFDELYNEIVNEEDNTRRKKLMESMYLSSFGFTSFDDLESKISDIDRQLVTLKENLSRVKERYALGLLLTALDRIRAGEPLEGVLNESRYDLEGLVLSNDDPEKTFVITLKNYLESNGYSDWLDELYSVTEKRSTFLFIPISNHAWENTEGQDEFYSKLKERYEYDLSISQDATTLASQIKLLEDTKKSCEETLNYLEDLVEYSTRLDFNTKSTFNDNVEALITDIRTNYVDNSQVDAFYAFKSIDDQAAFLAYMINGNPRKWSTIRDMNISFVDAGDRTWLTRDIVDYLEVMTEEQKRIYTYKYHVEGSTSALLYLEKIIPQLDSDWAKYKIQIDEAFASDSPVAASLYSIFGASIDGINSIFGTLDAKISGNDILKKNVYMKSDTYVNKITETIGEDSPFLAFWYSTGISMARSLQLVALGSLTGGTAVPAFSLVLMGTPAYGSALNDALDRGLGDTQAIIYAVSSAAIETAMESYSAGHFLKLETHLGSAVSKGCQKIASAFANHPKLGECAVRGFQFLATAMSQGLVEGEEEVSTEMLNYLADQLISGDLSAYSLRIEELVTKSGLSEEAAIMQANKEFYDQILQAFEGGFASGFLFGLAGATKIDINAIRNANFDSTFYSGTVNETTLANYYATEVERIRVLTEANSGLDRTIVDDIEDSAKGAGEDALEAISSLNVINNNNINKSDADTRNNDINVFVATNSDSERVTSDTVSNTYNANDGAVEKRIYSDYNLDESLGAQYRDMCDKFLALAKDDETREKLKSILYLGGYDNYNPRGFMGRNNPFIDFQRRAGLANLLITNPDTFDQIAARNITYFHGTNSKALSGILQHGIGSIDSLNEQGVEVFTGEKWSRIEGKSRSFTSFTDVLDIAEDYSLISPDGETDSSFPVIFGTTTNNIQKTSYIPIQSDVPEVGVKGIFSKDLINCILVPSSKIELVQKMAGPNILVLPLDGIQNKFYTMESSSEYLYVSDEEYQKMVDKSNIMREASQTINQDLETVQKSLSSNAKSVQENDFSSNPELVNRLRSSLSDFTAFSQLIVELFIENGFEKYGFSSDVDLKKSMIKYLIENDLLNSINSSYVAVMISDTAMLEELIGTERLSDFFIKNLVPFIDQFKGYLTNLDQQCFNKLFEHQDMKQYIYNLNIDDFAMILSKFDKFDNCSWLLCDSIVDRIVNMNVDEFYRFWAILTQVGVYKYLDTLPKLEKLGHTKCLLKLYDAVINKFFNTEIAIKNPSYVKLMSNSFLSGYIGDLDSAELKADVDKIKNTITGITDMVINNSNVSIAKLNNSLYVETDDPGYYNITYAIGDTVYTVETYTSIGKVNLDFDFMLDSNARILTVEKNRVKSALVLSANQGLKEGLNAVSFIIDGVEIRRIVKLNYESSIVDLNDSFSDINDVQISSVIPFESRNFSVDDDDKVYAIKYEIDGKIEQISIIATNGIVNFDKYIVDNNLFGAKVVEVNPIENLSELYKDVKSISEYKASGEIFTSEKYGGDQSDVSSILFSSLNNQTLSTIETKKANILLDIVRGYFPNAEKHEILALAEHYSESGCAYMALANAFATYIGSLDNGNQIFKDRFGYNLFTEDGLNKDYNTEAVAFDIYLNHAANECAAKDMSILNFTRYQAGISVYSLDNQVSDFWKKHGIDFEYKFSDNFKNDVGLNLYLSMSKKNVFNIINAFNFDLEFIDGAKLANDGNSINTSSNLDNALKDVTIDDNYRIGVGGHSMLLTEIDKNGRFIVSSWATKCVFYPESVVERNGGKVNVLSVQFGIQ